MTNSIFFVVAALGALILLLWEIMTRKSNSLKLVTLVIFAVAILGLFDLMLDITFGEIEALTDPISNWSI